jgi:hypothetical protein
MGSDDPVTSVSASGSTSIPELENAGIHDIASMVLKFQSGTT